MAFISNYAEEQLLADPTFQRKAAEAIDILREQEKNKEITEDDLRHGQEDIQKLTDRFIAEIDSLLEAKEAEITEF